MPYCELAPVTIFPRGMPSPTGICDHTVVWLRGEHDLSTIPYLSEALALATDLDDRDLVVDLRDTTFINAATIGVIIRARVALAQRSRGLVLRAPGPMTWRVLVLCGLTGLVVASPFESGSATPGSTSESARALRSWVSIDASERSEDISLSPVYAQPAEAVAILTHRAVRSQAGGSDQDRSALARNTLSNRPRDP